MANYTPKSDFVVQAKLLRVLKLIERLKAHRCTVAEMAECLDIHHRSVYRYLNLFQAVGFVIDKDERNRFLITEKPCLTGAYPGDQGPTMGHSY